SSGIVTSRSFTYDRDMAPRPRSTTDADLLTAAARAVSQVGPSRLTLADVAREAGVAPATLVQRFGSKRGLLLALVRAGSGAAARLGGLVGEGTHGALVAWAIHREGTAREWVRREMEMLLAPYVARKGTKRRQSPDR